MVNRDDGCWIEPLDHVSKTTNITTLGIKNYIAESMAYEPPEWARALLLSALEKDFSNAKEIISSVCARHYGKEGSHTNGTEREERNRKNTGGSGNVLNRKDNDNHKTTIPCPESVTECCRNAFREILMKDKFGELFNLVHGNSQGLLDFNLINIRMKAGTYGKLPELFAKDMEKVWDNIRSVGHKIIVLANTLQDFSGAAYQRQVFPSVGEEAGERDLNRASKKIGHQSGNKDNGHEHPFSMNQHHASKPNNQLRHILRPEKLNTPINMKTNKQNERLTAGMEAENVLQNKDVAPKNLDINQHLSNNQSCFPSSEQDLSPSKRFCKSCGLNERHNFMILCDACKTPYHTNCISPALKKIPSGGWCCASCVASGKGNKSLQKDIEKRGHHCVVCERLSRELEPQDSGRVLESPFCGVSQSPVNGEQICSDVNEKGLPRNTNKEDLEINQGEGAGLVETEVNISAQQEKYPVVDDETEGSHALNASIVVNASSAIGTENSSQDHEMKIPQYQAHNGTHIARYCLASPEHGVSSDENCGSKDNFRIFFRRKNKSKSGEDTDSTETGKSKRKCLESRRPEVSEESFKGL